MLSTADKWHAGAAEGSRTSMISERHYHGLGEKVGCQLFVGRRNNGTGTAQSVHCGVIARSKGSVLRSPIESRRKCQTFSVRGRVITLLIHHEALSQPPFRVANAKNRSGCRSCTSTSDGIGHINLLSRWL